MKYEEFIAQKRIVVPDVGLAKTPPLNDKLFPFQKDVVAWALRRGRAALFEDCGLGKTIQQLEWSRCVAEHTGGRVLILAPLAVSGQTVREGKKFGIDVAYARGQGGATGAVTITNYEMLDHFDPGAFAGVVLDESSIVKAYTGATKTKLLERFAATPYRLACTATPAPNDHLELGNHAEFLGILTSHEMIARWFINDTSTFGTYRLKGHAVVPFWDWVSSWARCVGKPSDLGMAYSDDGYTLPDLKLTKHALEVDVTAGRGEMLFRAPDLSATSVHKEKRLTVRTRAAKVAELVRAEPDEQWLLWCETDYEADALREALPEATDVRGSDKLETKEAALLGFAAGDVRILLTKPRLAGFGMNFQNCARVAFIGPTFSFEQYYQATRRVHRFGQRRRVEVHVVMAQTEIEIWSILLRKAADHDAMKVSMFEAMRRAQAKEDRSAVAYCPTVKAKFPEWLKEVS